MAINYERVGWDTSKFVNPTNMNRMDNGIKEVCDVVDKRFGDFTNVQIITSNGFSTMAADIGAKWSEIPNGTGTIMVNNGASIYHGTYYKYSDKIGSIHMTDCNDGGSTYVWNCNGGDYQLDEIGKAKDFLPLTGGTLSGDIGVFNGYARFTATANSAQIRTFSVENGNIDGLFRTLQILNNAYSPNLKSAIRIQERATEGASVKTYDIFGEHNKPSGSYTGNGSANVRNINTGGLGNLVAIYSTYAFCFLMSTGHTLFYMNDVIQGGTNAKFENGNIYLNIAHDALNHDGVTYYYQVM